MAGIWNINNINDANLRKVLRKLSFNVGEVISARAINIDKLKGEVLLKLLDGWQFSAKLKDNIDNLPEGLIKFQVEGFEDGKILLKMLNTNIKNESLEKSSIESLLKEKGMNVSKEDHAILDKMIKHDIPLTKDNVSSIKTLADFQSKIKENASEIDTFIDKYIQGKGIEPNSNQGAGIKNILKGFFNQLKGISQDDMITLFENNIDLTEENIKSFNDIFKGSSALYKDIKGIKDGLSETNMRNKANQLNTEVGIKDIDSSLDSSREENSTDISNKIKAKETIDTNGNENVQGKFQDKDPKNNKLNNDKAPNGSLLEDSLDDLKLVNNDKIKVDPSSLEKVKINLQDRDMNNIKLSDDESLDSSLSEKASNDGKLKNSNNTEDLLNKSIKKEYSVDDIAKNIKEQISNKTEEMKTIIRTVLEQKSEMKPEAYNNLIQALDKNINDFKVFNSISNQYYYFDLPVSFNNDEYKCKLMIKDERKKGKKIDSTDVKIAASVNTVHMGIIDAYIKVKNSNMDIDLKCEEKWVKLLEIGKDKILSGLSSLSYSINIKVEEKQEEMNITNCRDFFKDNSLGMINVKV